MIYFKKLTWFSFDGFKSPSESVVAYSTFLVSTFKLCSNSSQNLAQILTDHCASIAFHLFGFHSIQQPTVHAWSFCLFISRNQLQLMRVHGSNRCSFTWIFIVHGGNLSGSVDQRLQLPNTPSSGSSAERIVGHQLRSQGKGVS